MKTILKLFNPLAKWINNGGWFTLCILGAFGIIISIIGMIVLGVAVFGIYSIIKLIKSNKDIFKI